MGIMSIFTRSRKNGLTAVAISKAFLCGVLVVVLAARVGAVVVTGEGGNTPESRLTVGGVAVNGINHDGVGDLIVRAAGDTFSRSTASLVWTGRHLLTAAHSVTDASGQLDVSSTGDSSITFETGSGTINSTFRSSQVSVHPQWNGNVLDGFDVAVIDS